MAEKLKRRDIPCVCCLEFSADPHYEWYLLFIFDPDIFLWLVLRITTALLRWPCCRSYCSNLQIIRRFLLTEAISDAFPFRVCWMEYNQSVEKEIFCLKGEDNGLGDGDGRRDKAKYNFGFPFLAQSRQLGLAFSLAYFYMYWRRKE